MSTIASPTPSPAPVSTRSEARTARSERLRLLLRTPTVLFGVVVISFWVFCALFPGLVSPHDPIFDNQLPTSGSPSWSYPFGTDTNGRDVLSRVLAGSRSVLLIAPAATLIGTVLGTILGLITGYFRGVVDDVASRVIDAVLALPLIVTAILIVTAVGNSSRWVVALTIGLIFTPVVSRTVRAAVLAEGELDYVQAARLRGERSPYIMFSEILPNVLAPVVVEFTVRLGYAIFAVATLTFIGFGVQPPSPDWAAQINQYYTFIDPYWWMTLFPALAIASLVVSVNLVADGIREVYER
jgi:peptide/nickel transport system permease protein